jgi:hypothetical protein
MVSILPVPPAGDLAIRGRNFNQVVGATARCSFASPADDRPPPVSKLSWKTSVELSASWNIHVISICHFNQE